MAPDANTNRLVERIRQSKPVDCAAPYKPEEVGGKTILITGGASGFGAAFAREWAKHGAHMMIGDINDEAGEELVAELRTSTGSEHHHYGHCDVTDWQSQAAFFRTAARLSPTGGIDAVVANAGITAGGGFEIPQDLDSDDPPEPHYRVLDVNLTGLMHTAHLALFWLPRNGGILTTTTANPAAAGGKADGEEESGSNTAAAAAAAQANPAHYPRDRHILLVGSVAGLIPLPGAVQYAVSKHGVTGLFRTLRSTAWLYGIRINMLCPYFVDTPILSKSALLMLAGGGLATVDDVVDAAPRLMADGSIRGRALVVGPRMSVVEGDGGETRLVELPARPGDGKAVWECYAPDYDNVELFVNNYTRMLNTFVSFKGWMGWLGDVVRIMLRKDKSR